MIATCQHCTQLVIGPEMADKWLGAASDVSIVKALEYRQLSMLVAAHMSACHPVEVGNQIHLAMGLAGAAVAMRFVYSSDAALDSERIAAGDALVQAFAAYPNGPVLDLA